MENKSENPKKTEVKTYTSNIWNEIDSGKVIELFENNHLLVDKKNRERHREIFENNFKKEKRPVVTLSKKRDEVVGAITGRPLEESSKVLLCCGMAELDLEGKKVPLGGVVVDKETRKSNPILFAKMFRSFQSGAKKAGFESIQGYFRSGNGLSSVLEEIGFKKTNSFFAKDKDGKEERFDFLSYNLKK